MLVITSLKKSTNYYVRYFHVWSTFPLWNFINSNSIITQETLKCLCCWKKNTFYLYCPFSEYFSIIKISESCFIYRLIYLQVSSVTQSCLTLYYLMDCRTPGLPVHHHSLGLLKLMYSESVMPPTISSSVISFSSQSFQHQGLFQRVSSLHQVTKILEFQLQHQSFQWTFKTDSFRMNWFGLLAVQGTHQSLLQHHSSKASFIWCSPFFLVQISHPYMTTRDTIELTDRPLLTK